MLDRIRLRGGFVDMPFSESNILNADPEGAYMNQEYRMNHGKLGDFWEVYFFSHHCCRIIIIVCFDLVFVPLHNYYCITTSLWHVTLCDAGAHGVC